MYIFVAPRRIVLKEKEVQDFRAVAERLVDESAIEAEFPLVTERSPLLKVLIWILGLFSALMLGGLGYLWFVIGGNTDDPLLILGIMFFACLVGLIVWLVGVLFAALLYRREQDKRWAEMEELLDIVDEATIVLHEQNRNDLAVDIKRAETLVKKYRRYGL